VTHTVEDGSPEPWWPVDLGAAYDLDEIVLWNRTDCCGERLRDVYVLTSDTLLSLAEVQVVAAD
jgi:alpha-L-fucosidase 2